MFKWDEYFSAKSKALKILGDKAEIPPLPPRLSKTVDDYDAVKGEFTGSAEWCERELSKLANVNSAHIRAIAHFRASVEKNNFDLDEKRKSKKIQEARKLLVGFLDECSKNYSNNDKTLGELDKHLVQLRKYKQSAGPF